MLYTFLYNGIKIQQLNIAGIQIEKFYLRLDKKLILKIQTLNLSDIQGSSSTSNDLEEQIQYLKNFHLLLQYFQTIKIDHIIFNDYQANLSYDGEHFLVNLPQIYAKLNILESSSQITINFEDIYLKEYGIYYHGSGQYNLIKNNFDVQGELKFLDKKSYKILANLNLNLKGDFNKITLNGFSDTFENINFLLPLLPPFKNQMLKEWIFDNYQITSAKIKEFSLELPLNSKNLIDDSLESLYVLGEIQNAKVTFQKGLSPILSPNIQLTFKNNTLEFHPNQPTYKNINLQGSQVAISNIFQSPTLEVFIQTKTPLDDTILSLLESYHISLPIKAPKAKIDTNLALKVNLKNDSVTYKGIFKAEDAQILSNALTFNSQSLLVSAEDNLIKVSAKNVFYGDFLRADLNFIINTNQKTINGDLLAHSFVLDKNSPEILAFQNQSLPFEVDFSSNSQTFINLPTINFQGILQENSSLKITNLSSLLPFSKILKEYQISGGEIQINTKDFKEFEGKFLIHSNQQFLQDKNNKPLETMLLNFHYTSDNLQLNSDDSNFKFHKTKEKHQLELTNLIVVLDNIQTNTNSNVNSPLFVIGKNSPLHFKNHTILNDNFSLSMVGDELKFTLKHKNGEAQVYKKEDYITIDAKEFGDAFINALANKNIVTQGRFSINANTNPKGALIGKLRILNANINQLSVLQNLMAFIDTIPSLLTFKAPGFNNQGYYLKEGNITFGYNQDFLAIENLDFNGSSIDIQGKGILSLKDQKIDFYAQLITAKSLTGIINKIPIVNYITLGKEGKISTGFSITGDLENPTITTKTAQDILLSPFNILKRVITSPFEIFN